VCPDPHQAIIKEEALLGMTVQHRAAEPNLSKRILAFVTEHPGVKLTVIEEALGVSRIEVGRLIRELMDQGKVRRDEDTRQYFPL
jgi:predicted transcriptional regulator